MSTLDRRTFLRSSLAAMAAGCASAEDDASSEPTSSDTQAGTDTDAGTDPEASDTEVAASDTEVTATDTEDGCDTGGEDSPEPTDGWEDIPEMLEPTDQRGIGPFWREDSPERHRLNVNCEEGTPIRILLTAISTPEMSPIEGVSIEVFHCGPDEQYDMDGEAMAFRGKLITDALGRTWYESLYPPPYLDEIGLMRPHIHYWITADGYQSVSAQHKFDNDPELDDPVEGDGVLKVTVLDDGTNQAHGFFVLTPLAEGEEARESPV